MKIVPRDRTDFLVVHCSATPASRNIGAEEIDRMHRQRGFRCIGYHFIIRRDGEIETGRNVEEPGAHVEGLNNRSVGICLIGGVKADGKTPEENFTQAQFEALRGLLKELCMHYPDAEILGHRDLSPDKNHDGRVTPNEFAKACPCFDVRAWWTDARPVPASATQSS